MSAKEIIERAHLAVACGIGTIVLQSGEDQGLDEHFVREVVTAIKWETPLAVTLSLGERAPVALELWRRAGADRYLLRFETSDEVLYNLMHPPLAKGLPTRLELLSVLRELGYEVVGVDRAKE